MFFKYIIENWHNIFVIILLFVGLITSFVKWIKIKGPLFKSMSNEERIAYITRLLKNIVPIALSLVTDAEITFGGGTGMLKRSYVIDELYKRIPDEYKKYVTEENLDAIINDALEKAEELWEVNPAIKALVYSNSKKITVKKTHHIMKSYLKFERGFE